MMEQNKNELKKIEALAAKLDKCETCKGKKQSL